MQKFAVVLVVSVVLCLWSVAARADSSLMMGALGGQAAQTGNYTGGGLAMPPPPTYNVANLLTAIEHIGYNAPCPSYNGWYGPYGHIGTPCPCCWTSSGCQSCKK